MSRDGTGRALYRNLLSYLGGLVMVGSAILIVVSVLAELTGLARSSPYLGIVTYLLLPGILFFGLLLVLYGMRRESLRRRRTGSTDALPFPRLDLNEPRARRRFGYALVGGSIILVVVAFAAYRGFLFTESVTFCGKTCHTVMEPEHTAYLSSPHARVACVECHVGSGASWYVKSKLSGARQVWAVATGRYSRPIQVPIHNLRPARETCEHCHWPEKFFGAQLIQNPHFRFDEKNTAEQISLAVKTGGGSARLGGQSGIHWHMVINNRITFQALDRELQQIAVTRVRRPDGSVTEYRSTERPASQPGAQPEQILDCIGCHNRPSHQFPAPEAAVDQALAAGLISPRLPFIKRTAVAALEREYSTREAARAGLRAEIEGFYRSRHAAVARAAGADLEAAVATVIGIHERTVFPQMKVSWKTYASNLSHRTWPGCFRCHDGQHRSADGKTLSRACDLCHTLPARGPLAPLGATAPPFPSWHPLELTGKHAELLCHTCHVVGHRPAAECASCHRLDLKAPMMSSMTCAECHQQAGRAKPVADCRPCHDSLKGLHGQASHRAAACQSCHRPHRWVAADRAPCLTCHQDKQTHHAAEGACRGCHEFKK